MEIFDSHKDLRVVIRTPYETILDTRACEVELEDAAGRFTLRADGEAALTALIPGDLVIRKRDGSELHLVVGYGSLVALGGQARIVVRHATMRFVEPLRIAG